MYKIYLPDNYPKIGVGLRKEGVMRSPLGMFVCRWSNGLGKDRKARVEERLEEVVERLRPDMRSLVISCQEGLCLSVREVVPAVRAILGSLTASIAQRACHWESE